MLLGDVLLKCPAMVFLVLVGIQLLERGRAAVVGNTHITLHAHLHTFWDFGGVSGFWRSALQSGGDVLFNWGH